MGELAAVAAIRSSLPGPRRQGEVWIGDDAAVLFVEPGRWMLFAIDAVVAGVHADLSLTGLDDLGWKALAASASDIAAMGGEPGHAVVSVAAPEGTDIVLLYSGLRDAADRFGCPIVGGDLAASESLVVSVAVTGSCEGHPVLRSGARPGDGIYVTKPLGASAAGLRVLRHRADAGVVRRSSSPLGAALVRAHARPVADLEAGRAARLAGATAMIDVSDGFAMDVGRLAEASGIGVRIDSLPCAEGATAQEALGGGEDYALVFCAPRDESVSEAFGGLSQPLRVGTCTADAGERLFGGKPMPTVGWEHRI